VIRNIEGDAAQGRDIDRSRVVGPGGVAKAHRREGFLGRGERGVRWIHGFISGTIGTMEP